MTAITKIVLIGGAGTLGSAILHALQTSDTAFEITVLSRTDSKSTYSANVSPIETDYSHEHLAEIFRNQQAVICASGLGSIAQQRIIVDACITAGVYRFITNDFGNPPDFVGLPELEFARAPKLEILKYVQQQASANLNFTWTALATGHFIDYAIKKVPVAIGFNVPLRTARIVDGGTELFSSTTVSDIALAVVGILKRAGDTANRYLLVRTLETTQNDILTALEQQTGGSSWNVTHVTAKELYEIGREKQRQGEQRAAILSLLPVQIFEKGIGRSTLPKERYDNALLGVREKSVDDVIRSVLDDL